MKLPSLCVRLFVLIALLLQGPAFARTEGGSDAGHSGGGGTFVKSPSSRHLVFWDLFEQNPNIQDNETGDTIQLSPAGMAARGEWVEYRHFKSYAFLQHRLDVWSRRAPNFAKVMRENEAHRDLLLIGTTLSIQHIFELNVPERAREYGGLAVPGAYFDYSNARLFLDIKVWNEAGIQSQAAMLLHERLREVQLRFGLSNEFLQRVVYYVVMVAPENVREFQDERFSPAQLHEGVVPPAWPARHSWSEALPAAAKEVQEAEDQGVLGNWPDYERAQPPAENPCEPEHSRGTRPDGGSDAGHSGGNGCDPRRS